MKRYLMMIIVLATTLFGGVNATVDKSEVVRGDEVTLSLSASGENVKFPNISNIGGFNVSSTSRSQSITIVNGKVTKSIVASYTFTPLNSLTIPSYSLEVDGKVQKTKPIKVKVVSASKAGIDPNFLLEIVTDKKIAYVGEPITLRIIFKQKRDIDVEGIQFETPNFTNFWAKSDGKDRKTIVGDYIVHNITYILIPQQSGELKIAPIKVAIAKRESIRDAFSFMFQSIKWKNIYSNALKIKVKPLPNGVSVYGKFEINAAVDKTYTKANKPVNLTLSIRGEGNIDDVDSFKLDIPNATVYKNKPKIETYLENGVYKGVFRQKFAIVANSDFTIPSIKFSYFDKDEKKIKTIKTKPIKIKVEGISGVVAKETHKLVMPREKQSVKVKKEIVYKDKYPFEKWIYLIVGLFAGIVLSNIKRFKFKKTNKDEYPLSYDIRHAKSDKELLKVLLPYSSKHKKIKDIVTKLEENIYLKKSHKIDKKSLSKEIEDILKPKDEDI